MQKEIKNPNLPIETDYTNIKNSTKIEEKNKNKISLEIKIIGWVGTIILILAYGLNSLDYIKSTNILYPILNLIAALLLSIRVWADKNWSNLLLEAFWGAIAVVSIIKFFTF